MTSTTWPWAPIRSATASVSGARSQIATFAPRSISTSAVASPMPDAPPVTMTRLPFTGANLAFTQSEPARGDRGVRRGRVVEVETCA